MITPRPDPMLFSQDMGLNGIYDLSRKPKVYPKGNIKLTSYLVFLLKFIYAPKIIDGTREAPPIISVKPHLQVQTIIAMPNSA